MTFFQQENASFCDRFVVEVWIRKKAPSLSTDTAPLDSFSSFRSLDGARMLHAKLKWLIVVDSFFSSGVNGCKKWCLTVSAFEDPSCEPPTCTTVDLDPQIKRQARWSICCLHFKPSVWIWGILFFRIRSFYLC